MLAIRNDLLPHLLRRTVLSVRAARLATVLHDAREAGTVFDGHRLSYDAMRYLWMLVRAE